MGNHIAGKNSNSETEIRDAIAPLNHLSDELETLLIGVRHLSEKECSRGVLAAILGSSAWVQVPRAVIAIVRDNEDPAVSHIQCVAGNRLPPGTPGRMFRIEGVLIPGLENEVTRAVPLGDSNQDVEAMLTASADKGPSKSEKARDAAPGHTPRGRRRDGVRPARLNRCRGNRAESDDGAEPTRRAERQRLAAPRPGEGRDGCGAALDCEAHERRAGG